MATKKNLPARLPPSASKAAHVIVAQVVDGVGQHIARSLAVTDRIEDAVKHLVGGSAGAVLAHRERSFLERIEHFEAYGKTGEPAWVRQHVENAACPRGALAVASAYTLGLEFVEEHYARYAAAYAAARKRAATSPVKVCGECGREMGETR